MVSTLKSERARKGNRGGLASSRCARVVGALLLSLAHCLNVAAFSALPYLPLQESTTWTYREGTLTYTVEVIPASFWDDASMFTHSYWSTHGVMMKP